ncbi:hypothetical protein O181_104488 [Austropuccinia psidii MF-1]|uniref:Uncharacterized protein n=1 Tax=Austropuccinia psidii MF-1 TaxID=1389203 RepID=A0A9Q3JK82_9BASI|nr:hypothetical protein [Austropuccinia psidii MF-1]
MEYSRTSTSSQRSASTFEALIESPEADITAIPVVRPESFPEDNNRDIPVLVQELVYGSKAAGVQTSAKSLDRHNELLSSSEGVHGPRKDRRSSEGLDTHVLQGTSPTDKSLVEKQNMLSEDQKKKLVQGKDNSPLEAPQASTSKTQPHKCQTRARKPQRTIRRARKRQNPSGTSLTHRITEFPKKRRQPWKMY